MSLTWWGIFWGRRLGSRATAVESRSFFDYQRRGSDFAFHVRRPSENEFFACVNIALDGAVDFCDRDFDDRPGYFGSGADDQSAIG